MQIKIMENPFDYYIPKERENKYMNPILLFIFATIINVVLSTIRSICTIKSGKWLSALTNAICYGFYPLIVMLTAKDTVTIWANMIITALTNFVCVWIIKLVEEKARKDRLWKIEVAVPHKCANAAITAIENTNIPFNYQYLGKWCILNCYCATQSQTKSITELAKMYKGKISAYESKPLL